jgi:hypothetical protein
VGNISLHNRAHVSVSQAEEVGFKDLSIKGAKGSRNKKEGWGGDNGRHWSFQSYFSYKVGTGRLTK